MAKCNDYFLYRLLPVHNSAPFNSLVLYRPFQFVYTFENQHDSVHY